MGNGAEVEPNTRLFLRFWGRTDHSFIFKIDYLNANLQDEDYELDKVNDKLGFRLYLTPIVLDKVLEDESHI